MGVSIRCLTYLPKPLGAKLSLIDPPREDQWINIPLVK